MKKIFKNKIKIQIFVCLVALCISVLALMPLGKAQAAEMLSPYVEALSERTESDLMGGVKLYQQKIRSYYDGITDPKTNGYSYDASTVQWVDLASDNEAVKIVTWSEGTKHAYKSSRTTLTAKHYEKTHPGWIVVAAVNGDFFRISDTFEAINLMVQDSDVIRPHQAYQTSSIGTDCGVLGWTANNEFLNGFPTVSNTLTLQIRNELGAYEEKYNVSAINTTVSETGITLITKDAAKQVDLTGCKVYVGEYELCRHNYGSTTQVFVKGEIVELRTDFASAKPEDGQFYLVAKDGSLDSAVSIGDYVRCQYDLVGEWNNIRSAIGYHHVIMKDGKSVFFQDSLPGGTKNDYGLAKNPRCLVGIKADGSTVLMVSNGRGMDADCNVGLSYFQCAEMMKIAGCKDVYQMDGGGSATLVVRNQYGNFDVVNTPSDGSERSIANAILFVMRDPGLAVDVKNTTRTTIEVVKNETNISNLLEEVKVTVDGKTYDMEGDRLSITGLIESTEYAVTFTYVVPDDLDPTKKLKGYYTVHVKTKAFQMPNSGLKVTSVGKTSIVIEKEDYTTSSWIQNVIVHVGDSTYTMGNESRYEITGLIGDTTYKVYFEYKVVEPSTGNVYQGLDKEFEVKTLNFELPKVESFEIDEVGDNYVKIKYQYEDSDDAVVGASIIYGNSKYDLTRKRGTVKIEGLDLSSQGYEFYLQLLYYEEEGSTFAKEVVSETLKVEQKIEEEIEQPKKGCKKTSAELVVATISVLSLATFVIRKRNN